MGYHSFGELGTHAVEVGGTTALGHHVDRRRRKRDFFVIKVTPRRGLWRPGTRGRRRVDDMYAVPVWTLLRFGLDGTIRSRLVTFFQFPDLAAGPVKSHGGTFFGGKAVGEWTYGETHRLALFRGQAVGEAVRSIDAAIDAVRGGGSRRTHRAFGVGYREPLCLDN